MPELPEITVFARDNLPEKRRLILDLDDGTCLAINFWWFGYVHYVPDLPAHKHQCATHGMGASHFDCISSCDF